MALLRSVATVGGYTMVSRVLGFVRDVLTAAYLGAGPVADAFFIAQRLPNLFRSLFAEGAFSAAFVPIFAGKIAAEGRPAAKRFAEDALALLLTALVLFLALGEAAMPWFLHVIAPGFATDPDKYALTVALTRITFPYLLFISLVSLLGGILNSVERFAAVAATPALLNIFLIGGLLLAKPMGWEVGHTQAWAISLAGFAQFVWLIASSKAVGLAPDLPMPRLTPEVKRLLRLMAPGVFGAGVTQINLLVSTAIASLLPGGAVSYLYYADRLNQLPLGVVGIAVGTAILPPLSRHVRRGEEEAARATQNRGIELALLLTLPAAAALAVAAEPILAVLFERGAFGHKETLATAHALAAYAAGLPAFVLVKVLAPAFFARHDTATPVKVAVVAMVTNAALTVGLMFAFHRAGNAHVGNAIATSVAGWTNALLLLFLLGRRGYFAFDERARRTLPRIILAALGMALLLAGGETLAAPLLRPGSVIGILALAVLVCAGIGAFGALAVLVGAAEWRDLARRLRRQAA
jgi:putative peptidoglycan lipid II flippase